MSPAAERNISKVIAIVGPTCTGKTALSIFLSREFDGEVVACDSRTIYRYMDIGTAKPTMEERAGVPHHMFDLVDPDANFTVAQYKETATSVIASIRARGRIAVVCGGTGLYATALLEGLLIPQVAPQPELRQSLNNLADEKGNAHLHGTLRTLDPITADRLNPNDRFRVIRALEVCTITGKPMSQVASLEKPGFDCVWIGLRYADRALLKVAITTRMQEQLNSGLVQEIRRLYDRYGSTRALINAVNYREFIDHFEGNMKFDDAVEACIRHNYQLARRQLMWFKETSQ